MPTAPRLTPNGPNMSFKPGTCFTAAELNTLVKTMLGAGHPALNTALAKLTAMILYVVTNQIPKAQSAARDLIAFLNSQITPTTSAAQKAQIQATINGILCFVGLPLDTFVVLPSDQTQTVVTGDGHAGITIPPGSVTVPTTLTITQLDPNGPSGLITKLDQYPTFVSISSSSTLSNPVVVGICLGVNVPTSVFNRLRLGHQGTAGFQITPQGDAGFLGCPTLIASASRMPGWMKSFASAVLPRTLYARQPDDPMRSGGIGGSATDFSPFDAVDPMLFSSGGIGGSATDFQIKPATGGGLVGTAKPDALGTQSVKPVVPGPRVNTVVGGVCTAVEATVGTALEPECRPVLTITTGKGTILTNVPVSWSVKTGGGVIAPNTVATNVCGTPFGASAATATNVSGKAGVCWTLGPNGGVNEVVATPSAGGDAPAGVTFVPVSEFYHATGLKITPTASATGASVTFDGLPHPGSGTCSNGLTPALTYSGDGSVPQNNGSYTLTVTCGAGSTVYNTVTATATISIGLFTPTVSVTCPASTVFNGADQTPCTAAATGAGGASLGAVPVTYAATPPHGVGSYTATGNFAAAGNYAAASGAGAFTITP
ncbi:MAG: hypothetical protein ACHQQ3_13575, partial [Gemmatimonadales bacterium]